MGTFSVVNTKILGEKMKIIGLDRKSMNYLDSLHIDSMHNEEQFIAITTLIKANIAFKEKLEAETLTAEEVDAVIAEFEVLQKASKTYRAGGNEAIKGQIVYWLNCWDDTTEAAIAYLNGVKSALAGDVSSVISYNTAGKTAFDRSKTYDFLYLDLVHFLVFQNLNILLFYYKKGLFYQYNLSPHFLYELNTNF